MMLEPGDIITTGTPPGVGLGMKPPRFLKAGDVVQPRHREARRAAPERRRLQERDRRDRYQRQGGVAASPVCGRGRLGEAERRRGTAIRLAPTLSRKRERGVTAPASARRSAPRRRTRPCRDCRAGRPGRAWPCLSLREDAQLELVGVVERFRLELAGLPAAGRHDPAHRASRHSARPAPPRDRAPWACPAACRDAAAPLPACPAGNCRPRARRSAAASSRA